MKIVKANGTRKNKNTHNEASEEKNQMVQVMVQAKCYMHPNRSH